MRLRARSIPCHWTAIAIAAIGVFAAAGPSKNAIAGSESVRVQPASGTPADRLAGIRAAFVVKFAKFATFDGSRFESETSPIVIGLPADERLARTLEASLEGRTAAGRSLEFVAVPVPPRDEDTGTRTWTDETRKAFLDAVATCHILYLPGEKTELPAKVRSAGAEKSPLIVVDVEDQLTRGGMIALPVKAGKVRIVVNRTPVDETGIKLASSMLRLAEVVQREVTP